MTVAIAFPGLSVHYRSEMRNKDGELIVVLFDLKAPGPGLRAFLRHKLAVRYDAERIRFCQRHRPPQSIDEKYRTGDPWPTTCWGFLRGIYKMKRWR